jgi:hypothetical protein
MDKILIMVDLKDDKNIITVTEGDIVDTQLYNREEIIEQFSEIIEFLMFELEEDKNA